MRILSQDGMIDVPYEQVVVQIRSKEDNSIIAHNLSDGGRYLLMAEYSTEAKAKMAMEMLRKHYLETSRWVAEINGYPAVFQFPTDEELEG